MANLLIVDDELSMRQFLTHLFQREGYAVRVAENGRKAMELLRQQPADVIISDVKMPDMGGLELLQRLLEIRSIDFRATFADAATIIADTFGADKVDVFVHQPASNCLVALGTTNPSALKS